MARKKNKQQSTTVTYTTESTEAKESFKPLNFNDIKKYLFGTLIITFISFLPALQNDFVFWDDPEYVLNSPFIKGFDLGLIFSEFYMGNYHPLTILWYSVEHFFFGFNPMLYHLNNLLFHVANTGLVYMVIFQLIKKRNALVPAITAVLFGIHPMHVESVAWVSELKDVLYAFFFLLSVLKYLEYIHSGMKTKSLVVSLIFFLLSCLSKAQAVTLAPVLVLIDLYYKRKIETKLILEKVPYFVMSLIFGLVAIKAQKSESAINPNFEGIDTLFYGSYGILTYLYKLVLPIGLSGAHPYPSNPVFEPLPGYFKILPVGVILIGLATYYYGKKYKDVWFGMLFFLVTVSIVLKFVPVGDTIIAERYTYIPYIGIFFMLAQGIYYFYAQKNYKQPITIGLAALVLVLGAATWHRTTVWKDTFSFWEDVSEKYPNYWRSYNCMGQDYIDQANKLRQQGNAEQAIVKYQKAVEMLTKSIEMDKWAPPIPYLLRGAVYTDNLQQYDKAIQDYMKVISFPNKNDPSQIDGRHNLGLVYYRSKQYQKAINILSEAIQLNPNHPKGYYFRGLAYSGMGQYQQAISDYNAAIQINPNYLQAYLNRGVLYTDKIADYPKGLADFQFILSRNPNHTDAMVNSGICLYKMKKHQEADNLFNKALQINPNSARIYYLKALNFASAGQFKQAYQNGAKAKQMGMNVSDQQLNSWKNN